MQDYKRPKGRSKIRTTNNAEIHILLKLEAQGYTVVKRGWPDFIAYKEGAPTRFIEVKPKPGRHLSPNQKKVKEFLAPFGVHVELMTP